MRTEVTHKNCTGMALKLAQMYREQKSFVAITTNIL